MSNSQGISSTRMIVFSRLSPDTEKVFVDQNALKSSMMLFQRHSLHDKSEMFIFD